MRLRAGHDQDHGLGEGHEVIRKPEDQSSHRACSLDDDLFLDVIDACLHFDRSRFTAETLNINFAAGGSVWRVAADRKSLQRSLDPQTQTAGDDLAADLASAVLDMSLRQVRAEQAQPTISRQACGHLAPWSLRRSDCAR